MDKDLKNGIIEALIERVAARATAAPGESWTAQLLAAAPEKIIKKFGEEAVELVIAASTSNNDQKNKEEIIKESADVLYHLVVLWQKFGITGDDVARELTNRAGQSGLAEKLSRPK